MFRHTSQRFNSTTYWSSDNKFYYSRKYSSFRYIKNIPEKMDASDSCYSEPVVISVEKGQEGTCFWLWQIIQSMSLMFCGLQNNKTTRQFGTYQIVNTRSLVHLYNGRAGQYFTITVIYCNYTYISKHYWNWRVSCYWDSYIVPNFRMNKNNCHNHIANLRSWNVTFILIYITYFSFVCYYFNVARCIKQNIES